MSQSKTPVSRDRLQSNADKHELKTKLDRLSPAIQTRLDTLGIDLKSCKTLNEAVDSLLKISTKLISELQTKESAITKLEETEKKNTTIFEEIKLKYDGSIKEVEGLKEKIQHQTSGVVEKQLTDYPKLIKEIVQIRGSLEKSEKRCKLLEEENRQLLQDIDDLIKKSAQFYPDSSNHKGEIMSLCSAPDRLIFASGASDRTIRLWKVNPSNKNESNQTEVFMRSNIDGKVETLSFSAGGQFLAAGTGFQDGPEGYILIWNMSKHEGQVEYAFRSRPTVRFGRVQALCFDKNPEKIYCGDSTGSVWCFHLPSETILAQIQSHNDVVYDIYVRNTQLFSVSYDGSLSLFNLNDIGKPSNVIKKVNSNLNENNNNKSKKHNVSPSNPLLKVNKKHERKVSLITGKIIDKDSLQLVTEDLKEVSVDTEEYPVYNGIVLDKNDKYPLWRLSGWDGKEMCEKNEFYLLCASRKIHQYIIDIDNNKVNSNKTKGITRIVDQDLDHIKSLSINPLNGLILICRKGVPRAKVFDIRSGKEFKVFNTKEGTISCSDLLNDNEHAVLCINEPNKPPAMKLWKYNTLKGIHAVNAQNNNNNNNNNENSSTTTTTTTKEPKQNKTNGTEKKASK